MSEFIDYLKSPESKQVYPMVSAAGEGSDYNDNSDTDENTPDNILNRPEVWLTNFFAGRLTTAGNRVTPANAMTLSAYFGGLRCISEDIGKLPLNIYERLERGKRLATDHPLWQMLHVAPNPEMSSMSCRETMQQWAMGWGNGIAEIEFNYGGKPIALHPLHPQRVSIKRDRDGKLFYRVFSDILGRETEYKDLEPWQVFHIHGLGNGVEGYSVLRFASESLGLSLAAQDFGAAFFGNGTNANGILMHPEHLEDKALNNLRRSWMERHSGGKNAHKPLILEEGMKWEQLTIPPEEAQFLQTRQFQVVEVCRWFRIPPHKLQHLDRATFSNIEHQSLEYVNDALQPWLSRWENEIQRKLIGEDNQRFFACHDTLSLLRTDAKARAEYIKTMSSIGAYSPNDGREMENMNPIPGPEGDQYYIMSNMTTLKNAAEGKNLATKAAPPGNKPPSGKAVSSPGDENAKDYFLRHHPAYLSAAVRVCNKEQKAFERAQEKYAGNLPAFMKWCESFLTEHYEMCYGSFDPLVQCWKPSDWVNKFSQDWTNVCSLRWLNAFVNKKALGDSSMTLANEIIKEALHHAITQS